MRSGPRPPRQGGERCQQNARDEGDYELGEDVLYLVKAAFVIADLCHDFVGLMVG